MKIEQRHIAENKLELRVKSNPKCYGFIEPDSNKPQPFILKYFYNDIYQNCEYADDMGEGIEKLSEILTKMCKKLNEGVMKFSEYKKYNRFIKKKSIDYELFKKI